MTKAQLLYRRELLPLLAGAAWLITLSSLLLYWLAAGRPRYPHQSNPYVAFISNIGAEHLKALFITGSLLTALSFGSTITAVHLAHHHGHNNSSSSRTTTTNKLVASIAVLCAWAAGLCLVLLSIWDTQQWHRRHQMLLMACFGLLAASAVGTSVAVYWRCVRAGSGEGRLRRWWRLNNLLLVIEACLGIAMVSLQSTSYYRTAGILEWALCYVGVFYMWSFVGFFDKPRKDGKGVDERTALLGSEG